jgi:tetratricopeptide (TPR) repeat protein
MAADRPRCLESPHAQALLGGSLPQPERHDPLSYPAGPFTGLPADSRRGGRRCSSSRCTTAATRAGGTPFARFLGYTEYHVGDFGEAAHCYERALSIFRTVGDRWGEAETLTYLGDVRRAAGELLQARKNWQQALAILDDLQHPHAVRVRAKLASMEP